MPCCGMRHIPVSKQKLSKVIIYWKVRHLLLQPLFDNLYHSFCQTICWVIWCWTMMKDMICCESLATCCMHQSLQENAYCCIHQNSCEFYPKVCWDSAMGDVELVLALILCSYKHHIELLGLRFVDPVWATKSNSWPKPSFEQCQCVHYVICVAAVPVN